MWTEGGGQSSPLPSPRGRTGESVVISQQSCASKKQLDRGADSVKPASLSQSILPFRALWPRGQAVEVPEGTQQDPAVGLRQRPQGTGQAGSGSRGTCGGGPWKRRVACSHSCVPACRHVDVCVFVWACAHLCACERLGGVEGGSPPPDLICSWALERSQ